MMLPCFRAGNLANYRAVPRTSRHIGTRHLSAKGTTQAPLVSAKPQAPAYEVVGGERNFVGGNALDRQSLELLFKTAPPEFTGWRFTPPTEDYEQQPQLSAVQEPSAQLLEKTNSNSHASSQLHNGSAAQTHGQQVDAHDAPTSSNWDSSNNNTAPEVHTSVESCFITHPGSLCCSTASVQKDHANSTCTVSIQTTVRMTEQNVCPSMLDMEELGWLSIRQTSGDLITSLNKQASTLEENEDRHTHIVHILKHGRIVNAEKMVNRFGHISHVVTLEHPEMRERIQALFKPRVEGDCEGWHRVPIEVAAYQLNLCLGMDYVPPAVYREICDVDWHKYELGGTFIYWCPNAEELKKLPMEKWSVKPQTLLSDTRILDVLIQNSDRHLGHFMAGEHWASGRNSSHGWRGNVSPVLIDHSAGFRSDAWVALEHQNAFGTGPTTTISAKTYLRLRFLDRPTILTALRDYITLSEINDLVKRRDMVLRYFDKLVEQRGYSNVVIEDERCFV